MVQISGLEEIFINMCIRFARNFLYLPDKIDLYFEDCPSRRFPTLSNAAESDRCLLRELSDGRLALSCYEYFLDQFGRKTC